MSTLPLEGFRVDVPVMVLGLDLSLASTGVAIISGMSRTVDRIIPGKRTGNARLAYIRTGVQEAAEGADAITLEGPSYHSVGKFDHERAGLWWLITHEFWCLGRAYGVAPPATLKKYATGAGGGAKAGKDQVLAQVIRRYLAEVEVSGNDEADALVLAAMTADHLGHPIIPVPQLNRTALASVAWPAT